MDIWSKYNCNDSPTGFLISKTASHFACGGSESQLLLLFQSCRWHAVTTAQKQFQLCSHWLTSDHRIIFVTVWNHVKTSSLHASPVGAIMCVCVLMELLSVAIIESIFNSTASNLCSIAPVSMWMMHVARQMCEMQFPNELQALTSTYLWAGRMTYSNMPSEIGWWKMRIIRSRTCDAWYDGSGWDVRTAQSDGKLCLLIRTVASGYLCRYSVILQLKSIWWTLDLPSAIREQQEKKSWTLLQQIQKSKMIKRIWMRLHPGVVLFRKTQYTDFENKMK